MPLKLLVSVLFVSCLIFASGCSESVSRQNAEQATVSVSQVDPFEGVESPALPKGFNDYWYAGEAEINRYELSQSRYGELHSGDAVMIFVTEDFLTDKQVKFEGGSRDKVQSILKLNATRKFITGIYPYSMMTSVFSPVNYNVATLKTATSSQEWCGHTYDQLNYRNGRYDGMLRSYFMAEGDQTFELPGTQLEDGIWTTVRLNPQALPTGEMSIIPGAMFLRFKHLPHRAETATATLSDHSDPIFGDQPLQRYRIEYQSIDRSLEITFQKDFPHAILAWKEADGSGLTTTATRTHHIKSPYWGQHGNEDRVLREKLGLQN
ncbi:hypothetical protein CEQ90_03555 [Lewinellaceae bacterium SD302]|nr:hypothetical protein CEQ90_03555 [Lewinellaceae bacterium SD302]